MTHIRCVIHGASRKGCQGNRECWKAQVVATAAIMRHQYNPTHRTLEA